MKSLSWPCLALAILVLSGAAAHAEPANLSQTYSVSPEEAADMAVVKTALEATHTGGPLAIGPYVAALKAVLSHAPPTYPSILVLGDQTVIRTLDPPPADLNLRLVRQAASEKRRMILVRAYDTYPMASLALGSYFVEARQPQQASDALDLGLALQPEAPDLTTEKAMALGMLGKTEEALALVDHWLKTTEVANPQDRARMLRSKGFNLVELHRLDEGEAAYQESLKYEPGHPLAEHELQYIAYLRSGAPPAPAQTLTGDKAKSGAF